MTIPETTDQLYEYRDQPVTTTLTGAQAKRIQLAGPPGYFSRQKFPLNFLLVALGSSKRKPGSISKSNSFEEMSPVVSRSKNSPSVPSVIAKPQGTNSPSKNLQLFLAKVIDDEEPLLKKQKVVKTNLPASSPVTKKETTVTNKLKPSPTTTPDPLIKVRKQNNFIENFTETAP